MKEYTIVRRPEKLDWALIPALEINELLATDPCDISAQARLCYDDEAIYVQLQAVEKDIIANFTGPLDPVSDESCLEFFFCPMEGDCRYFNIEFNANGAMFLGFGPNVQELLRLIPEEPVIIPQVSRTADGWCVTYSVPHSFVRRFFPEYAPASGNSIRANCYKCGVVTPIEHYMAWSPVVMKECAFHAPELFGIMYFG